MQNFLNTTTHSVAWFSKCHKQDELELKAPFQRNPVWTLKQKAYLIDTILHSYPIPEIYMQEFTDDSGNEKHVVVDGQQRLRAVLEYLEGKYSLDPEDSPNFANMFFSDLTSAQKTNIYNYNFVIRILPDMPDVELRAMFQRLNRNVVALNTQELRHATYWGQFIKCVENIASDDKWSLFGIFTANDVRRMLDVEYISELAIGYLHGIQNKKDTIDNWFQAYELEFPRKEELESIFTIIMSEILALIPDISRTRWRKKSDFYTLFILLAKNIDIVPFSREGRQKIGEELHEFAVHVDNFIADINAKVPEYAKKYYAAVERAASDLANRKARDLQLNSVLDKVFKLERNSKNK